MITPTRHRRGNATTTLLMLLPMLGFGALAVDLGTVQLAHHQLQTGLDAAALGGVGYLDGTEAGMQSAVEQTVAIASENNTLGQPISLVREDIVLGYYDKQLETFVSSTEPTLVNAVWIESDVGGIETIFASAAFAHYVMETEARAIARTETRPGTGRVECYLPLAVPDCYLDKGDIEDYALRFKSANEDNAGWAAVNSSVSSNSVVDQFTGGCDNDSASIYDIVELNNGEITNALSTIDDLLEASTTPWDETRWGVQPPPMGTTSNPDGSVSTVSNYGYVIEGPVILFSPDGGTCGASTQFNQQAEITGFAWGVIYDVDEHGTGRNIRMKLDLTTEYDYGSMGGGLATNVTYHSTGLVY